MSVIILLSYDPVYDLWVAVFVRGIPFCWLVSKGSQPSVCTRSVQACLALDGTLDMACVSQTSNIPH